MNQRGPKKGMPSDVDCRNDNFIKMDGCYLIDLELNLFIRSLILLRFF